MKLLKSLVTNDSSTRVCAPQNLKVYLSSYTLQPTQRPHLTSPANGIQAKLKIANEMGKLPEDF